MRARELLAATSFWIVAVIAVYGLAAGLFIVAEAIMGR